MSLVHYTDNNSLLSILEYRQLWATSYSHLNDQDEVIHLKKLFHEENNKFIKDKHESSEKYISFINKLFEKYFNRFEKNIFILSFTKDNDKFNLWSYFANNNGYCIDFNFRSFCEKLRINNFSDNFQETNNNISDFNKIIIPKYELDIKNMLHTEIIHGNVIYSEIEKRNYIKESLNSYYSSEENQFDDEFTRFDYLEKIIEDLLYKSYFFKKEGFEHENEYRFVFSLKKLFPELSKLIHYRTKGSAIVPYIKIDINYDNAIDAISVGPWVEKYRLKNDLEQYLENNYKYKIDVRVSDMNVKV